MSSSASSTEAPPRDPSHWLYRLTSSEWLAAADHELRLCEEALRRRSVRPGLAHARRAAGMAENAVLCLAPAPDERFGRSYMEHVVALGAPPAGLQVPDDVQAAARMLRDTPAAPPALIAIGRPEMQVFTAAERLVAHARVRAARAITPG